jgi:hypothetical protein
MGVRLEPQDEYLHELEEAETFQESMYFNVFDPDQQVGAFVRLGNRPNEGHAEMTVCVYEPDGRVDFMFKRPPIEGHTALDAGGLKIEVQEPFEHLTAEYRGSLVLLDDPLQMADPKKAFTENPTAKSEIDLTFTRVSDMFGGEPDEQHEVEGEEFARGHYEQLNKVDGRIEVGDRKWEVHGFGLRDHSWGKRTWQAPWYYRWLTGNAGDDFGFMVSRVARPPKDDGTVNEGTRGGFVWEDGTLHLCDQATISTTWKGEDTYHQEVHATITRGDRTWTIEGEVLNLIPLRNRREGRVTRISEGMTRWTVDDGRGTTRVGYGLSEYLDQIIDGEPVGLDE